MKYVDYLNIQPHAMFVFFVFRKSGITKICLSIEDLSAYTISWSHVDWSKFCIHLSSLKIPPSPYSKDPLKKTIIQIRHVAMSTVFHCTKFRLSKCNGLWVVSVRQHVHFSFQPPTIIVFFSHKRGLNKSCSSSKRSTRMQNFMVLLWLVQFLPPPQ
jgi:hypothetical protein